MLAKEISVKRYVVRLSGEERERLETLLRKGKSPAQRLLKARILLKADVSEAGEGWSDSRIIKALGTSVPCFTGCASNWWAVLMLPTLPHGALIRDEAVRSLSTSSNPEERDEVSAGHSMMTSSAR